jgi:hypothetical protein
VSVYLTEDVLVKMHAAHRRGDHAGGQDRVECELCPACPSCRGTGTVPERCDDLGRRGAYPAVCDGCGGSGALEDCE